MRGFSVGATAPAMAEIAALKPAVPPRGKIHLTAVAGRPYGETIEAAVRVRAQGLEPVPHLSARDIESHAALDDVLSRLTRWAGVQRMLIVGGDSRHAKGPFGSALELIESGLLQRAGIRDIAVAAYPEGHPRLPQDALDRALLAKIEAGAQTGLGVSIVTQLCFDADAVLGWVRRLRHLGIENPIRIGMAGPADLCLADPPGAPLRRPRHRAVADAPRRTDQTSARRRNARPVIRPLAEAASEGALGRVAAHFFAAADAAATARWAQAAASGRVVPEAGGGFRVEAPPRDIEVRA